MSLPVYLILFCFSFLLYHYLFILFFLHFSLFFRSFLTTLTRTVQETSWVRPGRTKLCGNSPAGPQGPSHTEFYATILYVGDINEMRLFIWRGLDDESRGRRTSFLLSFLLPPSFFWGGGGILFYFILFIFTFFSSSLPNFASYETHMITIPVAPHTFYPLSLYFISFQFFFVEFFYFFPLHDSV